MNSQLKMQTHNNSQEGTLFHNKNFKGDINKSYIKKKSNGLLKNISVQCDLMACKDFPIDI